MASNGNQQEEPIVAPAEETSAGLIVPEAFAGDSAGEPSIEIVEVDEILAELADLDPADATGPAARVAELLGTALDREGR
jgi:hypothetical protein